MRFSKIEVLRAKALVGVAVVALTPSMALAQEEGLEPEEATEQGTNTAGEEIVVTGTLIRGKAPVGSNLIGVGEQRIEETAAASGNELLASIPQVTNYFNAVPVADLAIAANQIQISRPNLRQISPSNAASSATLILVDGHRIASAGVNQASIDPDVIPIGAIERVDVVTEGGSAIYGADAVAGVINFVTRRRFDGVQIDGSYGFADDYYQWDVNAVAGTDWGSGSAYAAYSYSKSDELYGRERDFIRGLAYTSQPYTPLGRECAPGNLTVNSVFSGITVFSASVAAPGFAAGSVNACDTTDNATVIPDVQRHGALASLSQDLSDATEVNIRAFYSQRDTLATSELRGSAQLPATFAIPATVPLPPFPLNFLPRVATGSFSFSPVLGTDAGRSTTKLQEWGANVEMRHQLTDSWDVTGLLNYSRSNTEFILQRPNVTRLNAAGLAGTIQPFNLAASNPAVIADVIDNYLAGQAIDDLVDLRLIAQGSLFTLGGGDAALAVGVEFMRDQFKLRTANDVRAAEIDARPFDRYDRDVYSIFGELLLPFLDIVEVSLAGRYDDYEDFGTTFNPKVGVSVHPSDWLTLRGNWGTSFTAPTPLDQLRSGANTISAFPFVAFTRPGDTPLPGTNYTVALQGSQPNLQPQEAETWSVGFDADLPFVPGLKLTASYYNVDFSDILGTPTPGVGIFADFPANIQTSVTGIPAADLLAFGTLAPGGTAVAQALISQGARVYELVDFRTGNFGSLKVEGIDFGANYRTDTGFGAIDFGVNGNYQLSRKAQVSPTSAVVDQLAVNNPELRVRSSIGADVGNFRAQATWNHTGGYDIVPLATVPVQDSVDAFDTVDLFFKYDLPAMGFVSNLSLTLNVDNVFDVDPPVFFGNGPNESGYANGFTFGRMFVLGAKTRF